MKLATLRDGSRDGKLVVVSRDLTRYAHARHVAPTLQVALEQWKSVEPALRALSERLDGTQSASDPRFSPDDAAAPLPRSYQWLDASAFLNHGELMQRAFQLAQHEDAERYPLMYQGASDSFLGPREDIALPSESHGIDFEGEFGVILDDVELGCPESEAVAHIRLLVQINDVSLRTLAPREMRSGFGFVQAKPSSSFAPVAVTPDELGEAWANGRINLPLSVRWNGRVFGNPSGSEMSFSFGELIAHAAATRALTAGTIIGSGTVSNRSAEVGCACIAERRAREMISDGRPLTGYMVYGDRVGMEARCRDGSPLFGSIDQRVVCVPGHV
jgi:fumarylacetoacetate (FAA) hydrolase